jgi:hypothetical protein
MISPDASAVVSDGRSEILRGVLRGERAVEDCSLAGISVTFGAAGLTVESAPGEEMYVARVSDVAHGLLALERRFGDLVEWAQFVLGSAGVVVLDIEFETTLEGDAILSGLWDAAFGSRPSAASLAAARKVLGRS